MTPDRPGAGNAPATVYEMFAAVTRAQGALPFLALSVCAARDYLPKGAAFTYREADDRVCALAAEYRRRGYGPGHRVALILGNRPDYFWHFLALNAVGACACPLNPDYLEGEFVHGLKQAEICLAIVSGAAAPRLQSAASQLGLPCIVLAGDDVILPPAPHPPAAEACQPAERGALIIYTSGTTSRPKACMISNRSCLASGQSYADVGGLMTLRPEQDRLYVPLPTFHMNASVLALNAVLRQRCCLVTTDRFRASTWWSELRAARVTCLHYLGLIPPILLKAPPQPGEGAPGLRFGVGAGVDPTVHRAFEDRFGFPLIEVWGMTETSRLIANAHEPRHVHTRAFGRPRPPWQVRVAGPDDAAVEPGAPGELLVRCAGPDPREGFFSGYIGEPAATEAAWSGGWFHTGDVVRQDAQGMLYFVERRKNIIRRSGENIAAAEVEEALVAIPGVVGAVVLAVPDALRDEEPLACVVLDVAGAASADRAREVFEAARGRLAMHKLPGWIKFIDSIPVTPTQKARKDILLHGFNPEGCALTFDMRALKSRAAAAGPPAASPEQA